MLARFFKHIQHNKLYDKNHKLLLAISGGADSVTLAHLLKQGGFIFEMAHCNFKLRGKDSDVDEKFCVNLAKQLGVKIHLKSFATKAYASKNKLSIQMAARELRYDWFEKLVSDEKFDFLLTAHHANDNIETVLINLLRGTGIKGLVGIPEKTGKIVRPLLIFTREEINAFVKENKLKFRSDKSNLDDAYERNFLRVHIIPELKKINPSIELTFIKNTLIFKEESGIISNFLDEKGKLFLKKEDGFYLIDKRELQKEKYSSAILFSIISPLGYNATQVNNILTNVFKDGLVGKIFKSKSHNLTIDREAIIIKPNSENKSTLVINNINELKANKALNVQEIKGFNIIKPGNLPKKKELLIDINQLIFPLTIRTKITGDRFKPFGMKGFKLVSDFFKDKKMSIFEKENCRLLVNGNGEIIWIIGYRSDERYRVTTLAKTVLKLSSIE